MKENCKKINIDLRFPSHVLGASWDLVIKLLRKNSDQRIDLEDVLKHQFNMLGFPIEICQFPAELTNLIFTITICVVIYRVRTIIEYLEIFLTKIFLGHCSHVEQKGG